MNETDAPHTADIVPKSGDRLDILPAHGGKLRPGWQPGQSGNPAGMRSAGASIIAHMSSFDGMSIAQVQEIQQDKDASVSRRAAALQWLETAGCDMADFEPVLNGESDLVTLRRTGVPTRSIKKMTITESKKSRSVAIELRHTAGEALDRIMDRTHGKSMQRIEIAAPARHPDQVDADLRALVAANPWLIESITPAAPELPPAQS